jgi:hypothetical protein
MEKRPLKLLRIDGWHTTPSAGTIGNLVVAATAGATSLEN